MSKSGIQWTDYTVNPLKGCSPMMNDSKMSPACAHCYAADQAFRLEHYIDKGGYEGTTKGAKNNPQWTGKISFKPEELRKVDTTKKPGRVFMCSMSDLFHEDVPDDWRDQIFDCMARNPRHVFYVLTKRAYRMEAYNPPGGWPRNIIAGITAENQELFDLRYPALRGTAAHHKFLSLEPLLGPIELRDPRGGDTLTGIQLDQVIVGGQSGHHARPTHPHWIDQLLLQCRDNGIPFFFKQWGKWRPIEAVGIMEDFLSTNEMTVSSTINHIPSWIMRAEKYDALIFGERYRQLPDIAREVAQK